MKYGNRNKGSQYWTINIKVFHYLLLMKKEEVSNLNIQDKNKVLFSFSCPKTPRRVEIELGLKKLKMKSLLEKQYVDMLNPKARKGRLYVLSAKAKKLFNLSPYNIDKDKEWDLIGWLLASPKQRLVVLRSMDMIKRTSENIRERAKRYNMNLTRISTKGILNELVRKDILETETKNRKRYYWKTEKSQGLLDTITDLEKGVKYLKKQ